jgi:hypothetical protein
MVATVSPWARSGIGEPLKRRNMTADGTPKK